MGGLFSGVPPYLSHTLIRKAVSDMGSSSTNEMCSTHEDYDV